MYIFFLFLYVSESNSICQLFDVSKSNSICQLFDFALNQLENSLKETHNTCSLHLVSNFQNQTSHLGMLYMVY